MLDLRNIIDLTVENPTGVLDLAAASFIADEINGRGTAAIRVVLPTLYERLFRRKGLYLALELLDFCVRNCGLVFARHITSPVLKAMSRILQMSSMKEQTLIGQLNSGLKHLILPSLTSGPGPTTTTHATRDVVLIRCQKKILYLIQLWADAFMLMEDAVPDILATYRKLRKKGYNFPPREPNQRFLVKHAESSPAFDPGNFSNNVAESVRPGGGVAATLSSSEAASQSFRAIPSPTQRTEAMRRAFVSEESQSSRLRPASLKFTERQAAAPISPRLAATWDREQLARTAERVASAVAAQRRPRATQSGSLEAGATDSDFTSSFGDGNNELVDLVEHMSKIVTLARASIIVSCPDKPTIRNNLFVINQIGRVLPLAEQRIDAACRSGTAADDPVSTAQLNLFIDLHEELVHHYHRLSSCPAVLMSDEEKVQASVDDTQAANATSHEEHVSPAAFCRQIDSTFLSGTEDSTADDRTREDSKASAVSAKKPLPRLLSFDDDNDAVEATPADQSKSALTNLLPALQLEREST